MSVAANADLGATGPRLTAAIIATNERDHIVACLQTLAWADARLVLDGGSDDGTPELARQAGALVFHRPFDTFARQRNATLALASTEWVLFVDADERVSPELAAEARAATCAATGLDGFWLPRQNLILGGWVRHGGWYPDYQLRLLRREAARYDEDRPVHEVVQLTGEAGRLTHTLTHHNYTRWDQLLRKQAVYSRLEARRLRQLGVRPLPHRFLIQPCREFWRRFVALAGWRDGWRGLLLATLLAYFTFDTFVRLATDRDG